MNNSAWVTDQNFGLFTDLYQLTMLQAYVREDKTDPAVFSLFSRNVPQVRNYLVAAGLEDALAYISDLQFSDEALQFLADREEFNDEFVDYLNEFAFTGDVHAVPEGTPVFADEPLIEVEAPLPEAQILETMLLNQINFQTTAASKASRVVRAADGRVVADFGMRRMHGTDAAMKAARAFHIAGVTATSNVLAGQIYGIPITGTMAHSYIQAHEDELAAFRAFNDRYPETVLLVDTYDTIQGVHRVVELANRLGDAFTVSAVRLDSGDLAELARRARSILDDGGLTDVSIFASGGLDEETIAEFVRADAPIDGFGVGTKMGVSADAPSLDTAYKLVSYGGKGRMKLSSNKQTLPGRKQVFRQYDEDGTARRDTIGLREENRDGRPLLEPVMKDGKRLPAHEKTLDQRREYAQQMIQQLPPRVQALKPADPPYSVEVSAKLRKQRDRIQEQMETKRIGQSER